MQTIVVAYGQREAVPPAATAHYGFTRNYPRLREVAPADTAFSCIKKHVHSLKFKALAEALEMNCLLIPYLILGRRRLPPGCIIPAAPGLPMRMAAFIWPRFSRAFSNCFT